MQKIWGFFFFFFEKFGMFTYFMTLWSTSIRDEFESMFWDVETLFNHMEGKSILRDVLNYETIIS